MKNLIYLFREFIQGIKNIYAYLPVIYKDRDWDFSFYEQLMLFKFKRMHKTLSKRHWPTEVNYERTRSLKALKICINILERRTNDFYFDNFSYLIDQDIAFVKVGEFYEIGKDYQISSNMKKYNTLKAKSWAIEKRDYKLYHKLILEYSEYWWD